jgi:hypothetical protein
VSSAPTSPKQFRPPSREQLVQALLYLIEGHDVPDRYLLGLIQIAMQRLRARRGLAPMRTVRQGRSKVTRRRAAA